MSTQYSTTEQRFWSKVNLDGPIHPVHGQCWTWTGKTNGKGYGRFWIKSRFAGAHVASWMISIGPTEGKCVLHKCDNPRCVNPYHLFLGTQTDNNVDMVAKKRHYHGEKHRTAKLTDLDVSLIRELGKTNSGADIARLFGLTRGYVSKLLRRTKRKCA